MTERQAYDVMMGRDSKYPESKSQTGAGNRGRAQSLGRAGAGQYQNYDILPKFKDILDLKDILDQSCESTKEVSDSEDESDIKPVQPVRPRFRSDITSVAGNTRKVARKVRPAEVSSAVSKTQYNLISGNSELVLQQRRCFKMVQYLVVIYMLASAFWR